MTIDFTAVQRLATRLRLDPAELFDACGDARASLTCRHEARVLHMHRDDARRCDTEPTP